MDIFAECARQEYMNNAGAANQDFDAYFPRTR
jgi:hypothetical protein